MREKILIDALEKIRENPYPINVFKPLTNLEWGYIKNGITDTEISLDRLSADIARTIRQTDMDTATKALSDYASAPKEKYSKDEILAAFKKKLFDFDEAFTDNEIEYIKTVMDTYAEQFKSPSSTPESGQKEGLKTKEQHEQDAEDYFLKHCNIESTLASASYRFAVFKSGYMAAISSAPESGGEQK